MASQLLAFNFKNCTEMMSLNTPDKIIYFATQPPILVYIVSVFLLLGILIFLFGVFKTVGRNKTMLLTSSNYFIVFVFWLICGALLVLGLYKPLWIKPFL